MAEVRFDWNRAKIADMRQEVAKGLLKMGADIASKARYNAPVLSGALRNTIRITADGDDKVYVLAGGSVGGKKVDYALLREFVNKKHPSTTHYMGRAFDSVTRGDIKRYFGGVK